MTKHHKHMQKRDINSNLSQLDALQERQELKQKKSQEMAEELIHELAVLHHSSSTRMDEAVHATTSGEPKNAREEMQSDAVCNTMAFFQENMMQLARTQLELSMNLFAIWTSLFAPAPRRSELYPITS